MFPVTGISISNQWILRVRQGTSTDHMKKSQAPPTDSGRIQRMSLQFEASRYGNDAKHSRCKKSPREDKTGKGHMTCFPTQDGCMVFDFQFIGFVIYQGHLWVTLMSMDSVIKQKYKMKDGSKLWLRGEQFYGPFNTAVSLVQLSPLKYRWQEA